MFHLIVINWFSTAVVSNLPLVYPVSAYFHKYCLFISAKLFVTIIVDNIYICFPILFNLSGTTRRPAACPLWYLYSRLGTTALQNISKAALLSNSNVLAYSLSQQDSGHGTYLERSQSWPSRDKFNRFLENVFVDCKIIRLMSCLQSNKPRGQTTL